MDSKLMSTKEFIDTIMNFVKNLEFDKVDCDFSVVPSIDASIDKRLLNMEAIYDIDYEQGYGMRCFFPDFSEGDGIITMGAYGYTTSLVYQLLFDGENDYDEFYKELLHSLRWAIECSRDNCAEDRDVESLVWLVKFLNGDKQKGEN